MPRSVRLASDVLVGRGPEVRDVTQALVDLPHGRPRVVAVAGAAGMGKTRFVESIADGLCAAGLRVMVGRCLGTGVGAAPYAAFVGAFRSVDPPAVQVLDALTGAVEMRRARLFELLRSTTVALARTRPTVLVVEDVHWSDRITRDALLYLVALVRDGRWGVLLTYRDDEVAARPAVREFLDTLHSVTVVQVSLNPLTPREVGAQVAGIAGAPISEDEADRIHHRSGGIPLLVEEVLAAERAGIRGVPEHLRDLFVGRVRRLGTMVARVVEVVAVAGDRCDGPMIATVLRADRSRVAGALDRAVSADILVTEDDGYRMRHDLLRDAVYGSLPPSRRRHLHRRIATGLSAAGNVDVAALATHWFESGDRIRAAQANLDAVRLAERVHAPAAVRTYLQRALEHLDALPVEQVAAIGGRTALLARLAEVSWFGGAFERAVLLAEESVAGTRDPADLAVRLERLARYRWVTGDGAGAFDAHRRSVNVLPDDAPSGTRARVFSGYAWHLAMAMRTDEARQWSELAISAAEDSGEPLERCRALLARGMARSDGDDGLSALWMARDLAIQCDSGDELGRAHAALDLALRRPRRVAEREAVLRDGLDYARAHGLMRSYGMVMAYLLADVLLSRGRWDEAAETLDGVTGAAVTGLPAMFGEAYRARLASGRGRSVGEHAARVSALAGDLPEQTYPLVVAACARAEDCLWQGEIDDAVEHAEQARQLATDPLAVAEADVIYARAVADRSERARVRRHPVSAGGHDYRVLTGTHPLIGPYAATVRAELFRRDGHRDPAPWREAVAAWTAEGDPYRTAYCQWRLAYAALAGRAGRPDAVQALTEAARTATRLGARPLERVVRSLAAAARIGLGDDDLVPAAGELGLTLREQEIVPLLVAGRTNKEIGEILVISPRTVGVHVSRILRKLGATRRTEAADIARRRGLVG